MTPQTLIIDRYFRGVGRIKRASGTTKPVVRKRLSKMLTRLFEEGRTDLLRAIRDGELSMLQVLGALQRKGLDDLPTGKTAKLLVPTMEAWIDGLIVPDECSADHQDSLRTSLRYFKKHKPKAFVSDLPEILEALRETLGRKHPRSFNLARSAAMAFVRSTFKKSHPLWLACSAVERRKSSTTVKRRPLTPQMMLNVFPNRESDHVDAIAWGMATTGMGQKEYWGIWETRSDRVHIIGTKRKARVRDVPLLMVPTPPQIHRRTFEDKIRARATRVTPYDLRRTYANWLESSGIPRQRRKMYMGHAAGDITDLYERHEVEAFLKEDAAKIRAFLKLSPTIEHTIQLMSDDAETA